MPGGPRLFVPDDLFEDAVIGASPDQAHYLRSVLRFSGGETLKLFNGRDGEWSARLDGVGKGWASIRVLAHERAQTTPPDLHLLFAPVKRARHDFLIQKAVELGVTRLTPVLTARTMVERVKGERLAANAIEAAAQCERLDVPAIDDPQPLGRVLESWPEDRRLMLCAETGTAVPIAEAVGGPADPNRPRWAILVGPEGGFSDAELASLRHCPFVVPVGLGPRILRAETAALAAIAVWQSVAGDWGSRPRQEG